MGKTLLLAIILLVSASIPADAECVSAEKIRLSAEKTGSTVAEIVPLRGKIHQILLLFADGSGAVLTLKNGCVTDHYVENDPSVVASMLVNEGLGS